MYRTLHFAAPIFDCRHMLTVFHPTDFNFLVFYREEDVHIKLTDVQECMCLEQPTLTLPRINK